MASSSLSKVIAKRLFFIHFDSEIAIWYLLAVMRSAVSCHRAPCERPQALTAVVTAGQWRIAAN
jgi:hypothetical protein